MQKSICPLCTHQPVCQQQPQSVCPHFMRKVAGQQRQAEIAQKLAAAEMLKIAKQLEAMAAQAQNQRATLELAVNYLAKHQYPAEHLERYPKYIETLDRLAAHYTVEAKTIRKLWGDT
jgi:membrane-bound lytic murein transglycosylase B